MQRTKGKVFERRIAAILRERWPGVEIRRSSQAERAYEPDVFARGHAVLERLWLELQDARVPTPLKKLEQAERDIAVLSPAHTPKDHRIPVVVWHRIREREVNVTTRLWVLDWVRYGWHPAATFVAPVTLNLTTFISLLRTEQHEVCRDR